MWTPLDWFRLAREQTMQAQVLGTACRVQLGHRSPLLHNFLRF